MLSVFGGICIENRAQEVSRLGYLKEMYRLDQKQKKCNALSLGRKDVLRRNPYSSDRDCSPLMLRQPILLLLA